MKGKRPTPYDGQPLEAVLDNGTEADLTREIVRRYAHALDNTTSARDTCSLARGMFEAMDRLKAIESMQSEDRESPLALILGKAAGAAPSPTL